MGYFSNKLLLKQCSFVQENLNKNTICPALGFIRSTIHQVPASVQTSPINEEEKKSKCHYR